MGILVVVFVESGVLFPILPGDSPLFVAGMLAAGTAAEASEASQAISNSGTAGVHPDRRDPRRPGRLLRRADHRHLDVQTRRPIPQAEVPTRPTRSSEQRGPFAIVIARFVPIVRTLAPIVAGAARNALRGAFSFYNILGAVIWGVGLVLLGLLAGSFEIIQKPLEPIFILIVLTRSPRCSS